MMCVFQWGGLWKVDSVWTWFRLWDSTARQQSKSDHWRLIPDQLRDNRTTRANMWLLIWMLTLRWRHVYWTEATCNNNNNTRTYPFSYFNKTQSSWVCNATPLWPRCDLACRCFYFFASPFGIGQQRLTLNSNLSNSF